jgi:hypothetical protein
MGLEEIAKYVAGEFPEFDTFPALPSTFHVEIQNVTIEQVDGNFEEETTFEIGKRTDATIRHTLGTITVKSTYYTYSDARSLSPEHALTGSVEFEKVTTPSY